MDHDVGSGYGLSDGCLRRIPTDRQQFVAADLCDPDAEVAPQESVGTGDEHAHDRP
jgi:hypothetical protein